ncbi:MAG TPA: hypothetical protein VII52_10405 [Gemmatimonadaceae bacterium]
MHDDVPAPELTTAELVRLHPRTNLAVLRRLLVAFADIDDPAVRATLLDIAAGGPIPEHTAVPRPARSHPVGKRRKLAFLPREYVDVLFFTDNEPINELLGQLFDPAAT